jgi:hypothetical protein
MSAGTEEEPPAFSNLAEREETDEPVIGVTELRACVLLAELAALAAGALSQWKKQKRGSTSGSAVESSVTWMVLVPTASMLSFVSVIF